MLSKAGYEYKCEYLREIYLAHILEGEEFEERIYSNRFYRFNPFGTPRFTMADPAAIRGALERIGFSQQARTYIVNNQGIDEIEELRILTNEEVESLCKNVRRPGVQYPTLKPDKDNRIIFRTQEYPYR